MIQHSPDESNSSRQRNTLSDRILRSFPPQRSNAAILAGGDSGPWTLEQLHEEDLLHNLKGKLWTQVPPEIIARHLGDFVLLTAQAFAVYIPAWLLFSLYNDNLGGEYIAHTFAPDELHGSSMIRQLSVEMFRALHPLQRRALRDFLIYLSEYHPSDYIADRAAAAVDSVSDLIAIFEQNPQPGSPPGPQPDASSEAHALHPEPR